MQKFQQLLQEKKEAHYEEILHQYAAQVERWYPCMYPYLTLPPPQDTELEALVRTVTTNIGTKKLRYHGSHRLVVMGEIPFSRPAEEVEDYDDDDENSSLLSPSDSGYN